MRGLYLCLVHACPTAGWRAGCERNELTCSFTKILQNAPTFGRRASHFDSHRRLCIKIQFYRTETQTFKFVLFGTYSPFTGYDYHPYTPAIQKHQSLGSRVNGMINIISSQSTIFNGILIKDPCFYA